MKVYLVCGVIGSGKDFFFKKYKRENPKERIEQLVIANSLRLLASKIYGLDLLDNATYEAWKEQNRQKLVDLGSNLKDIFGEDILTLGVTNKIKDNQTYILTDFRFPAEFFSITETVSLKDITVVFMNYKSARYCLKPEQVTERMACWLVAQGYKDGQEWDYWQFEKVMKRYKEFQFNST